MSSLEHTSLALTMPINRIEDTRPTKRRRVEETTTSSVVTSKCLTWFISHESSMSEVDYQVNASHPLYVKTPAEVILDVVDMVLEDAKSEEERALIMMNLQLVCKRFKDIIDARPKLWSYIDFRMDVKAFRLRIERSKNAPLRFHLVVHNRQIAHPLFRLKCLLMRKLCGRITSAIVDIFIDDGSAGLLNRRKTTCLKNWDWSAVKDMCFNAAVTDELDLSTLMWKTPALDSLECGWSPDSTAYEPEGSLRRVIFRPGWPYNGRTVLQLLSKVADSVEEVVFDFSNDAGIYLDEDEEAAIVHQGWKQFPLLKRVSIVLLDVGCDATLFRVLTHCDFSNAGIIEITTFLGYRDELDDEDGVLFDRFLEQQPSAEKSESNWSRIPAGDEHGDLSKDQYVRTVT